MKKNVILSSLVLLVACGLWVIWRLATGTGQGSSQSVQGIEPRKRAASPAAANVNNTAPKESNSRNSQRSNSDSAISDGMVWSLGKAVSELKSLCEKKEASRARLMDEKEVDGATVYFLDVSAPSQDEIKDIRASIAEVQSRVGHGNKQKMDEMVTWMVDRYDPFGATGRKIIGVRIGSEPGKPISGWVLPTDDPESSMRQVSSGTYTAPENMQFYVSSYNDISERFNALLVYDAASDLPGAELNRKETEQDAVAPNGP